MFSDPDFQTQAPVDKRGRRVQSGKQGDDLKRYYHLNDGDDQDEGAEEVEEEAVAGAQAKGKKAAAGGKKVAAAAGKVAAASGKAANGKNVKKQPASEEGAGGKAAAAGGKVAAASKKVAEAGEKVAKAKAAIVAARGGKGGKAAAVPPSDEEEEEGEAEEGEAEEGASSSDDEAGGEDAAARKRFMRARGMADVSSSSESESEDGADGVAEDEEAEEAEAKRVWGVGAMAANPSERIPFVDETLRIAVVDLDWDSVKAVDILAVLRSFAPKGGDVTRVTVYPSDYGIERMAEEAAMGPQHIFREIEAKRAKKGKAPVGDGKGEGEGEGSEDSDDGGGAGGSDDDAADEVDAKQLSMYERSKLRYYYAVAECDSTRTAAAIYSECDGLEFEKSACKFDLRFVPDEQSFAARKVRDVATSVPSDYDAPDTFNLSLQHTDPKLTWDADDVGRKKVLQKKLSEDQIREADFDAYLGSESDGDDVPAGVGMAGADEKDPEALRARYRALLLAGGSGENGARSGKGGGAGTKAWGGGDDEDEGEEGDDEGEEGEEGEEGVETTRIRGKDMDMEVTFQPGLEGLGEKLLAKKKEERERAGETVWEAYLRKRKEKRKDRKKKIGRGGGGDSSDSEEYDQVDEWSKGKGKSGNGSKVDAEEDPFDDPFFADGGGGDVAVSSGEDATDDDEEGGGGKTKGATGAKGAKGEKAVEKKAPSSKEDKEARRKGRDKEEKKLAKELAAKQQAELELLLMDDSALRDAARGVKIAGGSGRAAAEDDDDDDDDENDGKKKKVSRKDRLRLKKEQRKAARADSDDEDAGVAGAGAAGGGGGFAANLSDPRFSAIFDDHAYALDPTDPRFVKSKGIDVLAKEISKKRSEKPAAASAPQSAAPAEGAPAGEKDAKIEQLELRAMVAKLKRKAEAQQAANATTEPAGAGAGGKKKKAKL